MTASLTRRDLITKGGLSLLGVAVLRSGQQPATQVYQGANFAGWEVTLGDALYAAPGEAPVSQSDIETLHYDGYSELRANIQRRRIMAHNITLKRINDELAFTYIHACRYHFRLPYLPATDNLDVNAQTIEGGLFVWDGGNTRLDYGLAFQWLLNPWMSNFGEMRCWTDRNGGEWQAVDRMTPDTTWHVIDFVIDFEQQTTAIRLDGKHIPSCFTATPKPADWGSETAARLQAEIISLYPGSVDAQALHRAEFKDWRWQWESQTMCHTYLPFARR